MKSRWIMIGVVALVAAAAALAESAQRVTQEINLAIPVPCIGETLVVEGTAHVLGRTAQDGSGGLHMFVHFDARGQAVDSDGTVWEFIDQRNVNGRISADGEDSLDLRCRNTKLVARGGDRYILFDGILRVVTVDGEIVAFKLESDPGRCE